MTTTKWEILGTLKRIYLAVRWKVASISAHALSIYRGAIVRQMGGRSSATVTFQSPMRLLMSSPHLSVGPLGGFTVAGSAASTCGLGNYRIWGAWGYMEGWYHVLE